MTFAKLRPISATSRGSIPSMPASTATVAACAFRDDASRGAIFVADGDIEMPVTTIDEVLGDRRLTYVKMNIEGAEIDALQGGRKQSANGGHGLRCRSIIMPAIFGGFRNWCWN